MNIEIICNEDLHNADLSKKNRRKEGKVFCPHSDCKGNLGFINTNKMAYHFQAIHNIKYSDWLCEKVLKEDHNGIWPLCKCGCGEKVPFQKLKFSEYCKGHHHKGKQFGQQARQNMSEGAKEWQSNLTKEEKYEMHKKSGETNKSNKQKIRDEVRQKVIDEKYNGIAPKCPVCGHELEFVFKWRDFRKFCSVKCINTGRKETFELGDNDYESKDFTIKNLRELISVDQFFTKKDVAKNIVETLREILDLSFYEHIIEPSAGNGSISLLLENCEAYDIFPQHHSIKRADFFDLRFDYKVEKTLIVGNPPFGRQSSLALKFIKKSCEIADTVAFILPRSFKKDSVRDKVPLTHSCIFELDLNPDSFERDGISRSIQCVFQIWIRKDREKSEKYFSKDFSFCSKDDAHFSFRRAGGGNVGEISTDFLHKSESSHYFIKTKNANVIETLKQIDWKIIGSNTIAVKSVSKNEIYKAYIEKINENDKTRDKS